jgi:bifunctional N-acetylglucosamine-1-phosphate-uridyltransferase/glucosamine-1-phosphate-acetyltransferase GlmU-like protein
MRSKIPKVLHLISRKTHVGEHQCNLKKSQLKKIINNNGKSTDVLIKETISKYMDIDNLLFIQQASPLGTGDAIKSCLPS